MCYLVQVLRFYFIFWGEGGEGRRLRRIRCKQEKIGNVDDYMICVMCPSLVVVRGSCVPDQ